MVILTLKVGKLNYKAMIGHTWKELKSIWDLYLLSFFTSHVKSIPRSKELLKNILLFTLISFYVFAYYVPVKANIEVPNP